MTDRPTSERSDPEALKAVIEAAPAAELASVAGPARPQDLAEIYESLTEARRMALLEALDAEQSAELIANLPEEAQPAALAALSDHRATAVLEALDPDDLADALQSVEEHAPDRAEALKALLDPETRATAEALTRYEEDEAGGLMTPEFVSVRGTMTAAQVVDFLRRASPEAETVYTIYVVDSADCLLGVLSLRDLIVSPSDRKVQEIMIPDVVHVTTDTDQEEVAHLMADYDLSALPVVDPDGRLVGIVTVDDVIDVIEDEATEDIHRLGGAPVDIDYPRSGPFFMYRKRLPWLGFLVVSMTLTFNVIAFYEDILAEVVILAAFIPLLIDTGGNVGSQIATLVVRSLATQDLDIRDHRRVLLREALTGLLLGLGLAVLVYFFVLLLRGDAPIALSIAITMILIVVVANLLGAGLPFLFRRFGIDPALTSSPAITTVMDVVGLLIYFRVVSWVLGPLLGGEAPPADA